MTQHISTGPLKGVTVIELAHVMAGPTCGRMLADMGADVIKVERIPHGDDTRRDTMPNEAGNPDSHAFMMMNRNKRGIALDLKTEDGRAILRRLLARADVLVENYRHDTMSRLGLGWETLSQEFPRLIYCAVSGFGRTGPYAHRGGFDLIAQGISGLMSITGEGPGRPPVKVGPPVTDITAGILAAMGVVAALYARQNTGKGQFVDTSLLEAGVIFTYWHSAITFATGDCPGALGSAHPLSAPYQAYQAADEWINVGAASQPNWLRMVKILGAPELAEDPRFRENTDRMANKEALDAVLEPLFKQKPAAEWLAAFEAAGVPAGPILRVPDMHRDPQVIARDLVPTVQHSKRGEVKTIGFPVKFSDTPVKISRAAPCLGEHTREVLEEYGFAAADIARFEENGAVRAS
ncbi:CaiB/BaiF CoA transferase family protein [Rhodoligotrophos defluvii]|uniref:CaiB/BaiF CoA transferase family protein n=1 Tax=Rhodoligotrophos defluvii TaxID=2561934 RepID=UPI0010C93D36|nr:CoA transferase [Rhodoligotrophos defluvii]